MFENLIEIKLILIFLLELSETSFEISDSASNSSKIDSLAAIPLWSTTFISASRFKGAKISIMAVTNDIKVPTDKLSINCSEVTI